MNWNFYLPRFRQLHLPEVLSVFSWNSQFEKDDIVRKFKEWACDYGLFASNFYYAQSSHLHFLLEREFCRKNDLKIHILEDLDSDDPRMVAYQDFITRFGYYTYREECEKLGDEAAAFRAMYDNKGTTQAAVRQYFSERFEWRDNPEKIFFSLSHISEYWFNTRIMNIHEVREPLKDMPYPEYLKSNHWRNVRAAMLILTNSQCQASHCHDSEPTWGQGYESEMQVHHLTYVNRGNERYSDVVLLCKRHHDEWHSLKERGEKTFDLHKYTRGAMV